MPKTKSYEEKKREENKLTPGQIAYRKKAELEERMRSRHFHPEHLLTEKEVLEKEGGIRYPLDCRPERYDKETWKRMKCFELQDDYPATGNGNKDAEEYTKWGAEEARQRRDEDVKRKMAEWLSQHPGWERMMGLWMPPEDYEADSMTVERKEQSAESMPDF